MNQKLKILLVCAVLMVLATKQNLLSNEENPVKLRAAIDELDKRIEELNKVGTFEEFFVAKKRMKLIEKKENLEERYRALILQQLPVSEALIKTCPELNVALLWKQVSIVLDHPNAYACAFSPDGTIVATLGDGNVKIWDVDRGTLIHSITYAVNFNDLGDDRLEFSRDGRYLICHPLTDYAMVIDIQEGKASSYPSKDGDRFGKKRSHLIHDHIFYTVTQHEIVIRDITTGKPLRTLRIPYDEFEIEQAVMSPDGRYILMHVDQNDADIESLLWDVHTGKKLYTLPKYNQEDDFPGRDIVFSPDGNYIVRRHGNNVLILDTKTGAQKYSLQHSGTVDFIWYSEELFSPDSKSIVTCQDGHEEERIDLAKAIIWDVQTGKPIHILRDTGLLEAVFSPDGNYVITGSKPNDTVILTIKIWDVQTGLLYREIAYPANYLNCSFNSTMLIIGGCGGDILWDIQADKQIIFPRMARDFILDSSGDMVLQFRKNGIAHPAHWGVKPSLSVNVHKLVKILTIDQCELLRAMQMQFIRKESLEKMRQAQRAGRNLIEPIKATKSQWHAFKTLPKLLQERLGEYIVQP